MRALCPSCGFHHEVVRVLEDGHGEASREFYQVAPLPTCEQSWISDKELLEARARFDIEAILQEDDEVG